MIAPSISLCQQLVRTPSFSGDEQGAAEIAARVMRDWDFDDVCHDAYGGVIGVRRGARPGKTILFDAHLDVVAVTNREAWIHDPFSGDFDDGKIWGRGACDDKGPLAAMIGAVASIPRDELVGEVIVSASVCEENLTGAAFAHILDEIIPSGALTLSRDAPDLVIIGEPTDLKLGIAQKGRAGIVIRTHGKSAHTSCPELGENAVYKMIEVINCVRALSLPRDPDVGRALIELIEIISEPQPGTGFVPSACRARFVERMLPGESPARVLEKWQTIVAEIPGTVIELERLEQICYTGATLTMNDFIAGWRAEATWVERWRQALAIETFAAPFGTNASVSAARGIPTFILGPGSIAQAHGVDEWISVADLCAGEQLYRALIRTANQW